MNTNQTPLMLTLSETVEKTGLSYNALRQMCIDNEIVHIRVGRSGGRGKKGKKYLINYDRLVEYLNGGAADELSARD